MTNQDFDICHRLTNYYFHFHFEGKRSFTHNVSNKHFILWIYFNIDHNICIEDELKTMRDLAEQHDLKNKGWKELPDVVVYKTSAYEVFDKVAAFVFSLK